ncbi:MAG TPA: pyridoxamine 5'-phosphate oxidase family protein [Telluria sp.]|jgi:hypothetical protein
MRAHQHQITDLPALEALFGAVGEASISKETTSLCAVYRQWIEASPFAVLATVGPLGLDASPRGDPAPLVKVLDEHTLLLPERRGNNRIDSLRNIVADPRVALIFLIPGVGETLRVNGQARISIAPERLAELALQGKAPTCVIEIHIESVFFQCARAVQRARLWRERTDAPIDVPTAGAMLAALSAGQIDGTQYDLALPQRQRDTLY